MVTKDLQTCNLGVEALIPGRCAFVSFVDKNMYLIVGK